MNYKNIPLLVSILSFLPSYSSFPSASAGPGAGANLLTTRPGGLAISNSENDKEQKEKIDKVKAELEKFKADVHWKKRKEIITRTVVHDGIHPDSLEDELGSQWHFALHEKDQEKDFEFTQLLLTHHADPNKKRLGCGPILMRAKTVKMAKLLFDHGANQTVALHGTQLLSNAASSDEYEPELIEWYVQQGVDPNQYHNGETPLLEMIFHHNGNAKQNATISKRIRLLMQAGALLQCTITTLSHIKNGYNVAQIVKSKLDEAQKSLQDNPNDPKIQETNHTRIASFIAIRNILIATSNYRHAGLKADLSQYKTLLPVLCDLVVGYYIALEPRYEDLEAMPVPAPVQEPRAMYVGRGFPLFSGSLRSNF